MPWYWTDDIAAAVADNRAHEHLVSAGAMGVPIAIRRQEETLDDVIRALEDEGEIPLAA